MPNKIISDGIIPWIIEFLVIDYFYPAEHIFQNLCNSGSRLIIRIDLQWSMII